MKGLALILLATCLFIRCDSNKVEERWCDRLPRMAYEKLQKVSDEQDWFEVYEVEDDVFAIYEPFQWQEVISYLILGEEKALLFDTGNGIGKISEVTKKLTDLPITVLNSHTHFDHVGGNAEYLEILAMETPYTRNRSKGRTNKEVKSEVSAQALCKSLPAHVSPETHIIRSFNVTEWVAEGFTFDLGGRILEVISIPGHTPDAIALLDEERGLLWTGDSFYAGPIWLFAEETDLEAYAQSIKRLADLSPQLNQLLPAHNTPLVNPDILVEVQKAFSQLQAGSVQGEPRDEDLIEYMFEGFSFLMNKPN